MSYICNHMASTVAFFGRGVSPSETTAREGWLERPDEAFAHFRERGVARVVCEEKHRQWGGKGLIQPALKVRGPEYLRII